MFETSPVLGLLARALGTAQLRQAAHVANIANADVADFRRLEVSVDPQAQLLESVSAADAQVPSWSASQPRLVSTADTVNLDQEMASMAKDAIYYQQLLNAMHHTMSLLELAARDGRGG